MLSTAQLITNAPIESKALDYLLKIDYHGAISFFLRERHSNNVSNHSDHCWISLLNLHRILALKPEFMLFPSLMAKLHKIWMEALSIQVLTNHSPIHLW